MPPIRAAFLTSESCSELQRARIEAAFRTRVFSWYGHSERVIFAGECVHSSAYHHFPDYGILEIVDSNGRPCKDGERGELVGTALNSRSMPFVRYRTGDFATKLTSTCTCGRFWDRFADLEGRWKQDVIIGKNNAQISMASLNMHGPLFERVVAFQYYQELADKCTIRLVVAPAFRQQDSAAIAAAYNSKVGEEIEFAVQLVENIPLTARGKRKLLDSHLVGMDEL